MTSPTHWEYRLFKENFGDTVEITIREVYFNEAGKPLTATERGVGPMGETVEELRKDIAMMMTAFDLPIMSDADFSEAGKTMPENLPNARITGVSKNCMTAENDTAKHD